MQSKASWRRRRRTGRADDLHEWGRGEHETVAFRDCKKCGLNHRRLRCELRGGTLKRTASESRHVLKALGGGAWAFHAALLDRHPEIKRITIYAEDSGRVFSIDRSKFDRFCTRRTWSPAFGEQLALEIGAWDLERTPAHSFEIVEPVIERPDARQPALEGLTSYTVQRSRPVPRWMVGDK